MASLSVRAARIYYDGLRALRVPNIKRYLQDASVILCYHNVVAPETNGIGDTVLHMTRDRFAHQVCWLKRHYNPVPLGELVTRLSTGASLRSTAVVTFDDGYKGVFEHAVPILKALNVPATIFVVPEAIDGRAEFWWDHPRVISSAGPARRQRWLTELRGDRAAILCDTGASTATILPAAYRPADWGTIRAAVGDGVEIGVHSATHRSLPTLTDLELEREIVGSRTRIHEAIGIRPEGFAYPYGHWTARVRELVRAAGYRAGLTLDSGLNDHMSDVCCLRRVNVPAGISDAAFEAWAAGVGSPWS